MTGTATIEQAIMPCPQCDGEGGYPDGLDEAACHTECTRCAGTGWIVDIASLRSISTAADPAIPALRPIAEAPKDRTTIWAVLHADIYPRLEPGRPDLERWNGLHLPLRHPGLADDGFDIGWSIAAPVGFGGFPDRYIAGWILLPSSLAPKSKVPDEGPLA